MASILNALRSLFRGRTELDPTTSDEMLTMAAQGKAPNPTEAMLTRFAAEGQRADIINLCRKMYDEDTRASSVIQTLARDAVKGGFQIETEDERALAVAQELLSRINLAEKLEKWNRVAFRDGDCFLELGINAQRQIAIITKKPTLRMRRNTDDRDMFQNPEQAFTLVPERVYVNNDRELVHFAEWQIVHARWDHDEGDRYGRPLLAPARSSWKRIKEGELDIAVRRKTRAGIKFLHKIKGADDAALKKYQAENKSVLDNPFAAAADFFMSDDGDIKVIQGDANLGEIEDVLHHMRTWFLSSPVPMSILGYGQDINYSVVEHQKEQYDETLTEVQKWVVSQFIRPILEIEWLLNGILPETVKYSIKWPPKKQFTPEDLEKVARAALALRSLDMPVETWAKIIGRFFPDIEPEMLLPEAGAIINDQERLASIAGKLGRGFSK